MNKCVIITGPTASGKSSIAISLAACMNGVIISADSMQIYRGLNIGSAKPTKSELNTVEHRMIDILDICESFSVADFKKYCESEIDSVLANGKLPIICGGTGLYIDSLINNTDFGEFECTPEIRQRLQEEEAQLGGEAMLSRLKKIDPDAAKKLHPKDSKRIIRALEVYEATGKTITYFKAQSRTKKTKYDYLLIVLSFNDRQKLYERINARVDKMLTDGLLSETKALLDKGLFESSTASQAIGYKELLGYLGGEISLDEATELLKRRTRNYAKRQETWFARYKDAKRIMCDETPDIIGEITALTRNHLTRKPDENTENT